MKKYKDLAAGIVTVILASVIYISSNSITRSVKTTIGPDFMPKLVAVILSVLGLLLIVRELKFLLHNRLQETSKTDEAGTSGTNSWKGLIRKNLDIVALVLLLLYPLLISVLGFLLASIIYMIAHALLLLLKQKRNYLLVILYSVAFSTVAYFFFVKVLHVMLPSGILG